MPFTFTPLHFMKIFRFYLGKVKSLSEDLERFKEKNSELQNELYKMNTYIEEVMKMKVNIHMTNNMLSQLSGDVSEIKRAIIGNDVHMKHSFIQTDQQLERENNETELKICS